MLISFLVGCRPTDVGDGQATALPPPTDELRLADPLQVENPDRPFGYVGFFGADASGRMYVADPRSPSISVFESDGTPAGMLGAVGEGPGEFSRPGRIMFAGDSIVVEDSFYRRLVVYEADGTPRGRTEHNPGYSTVIGIGPGFYYVRDDDDPADVKLGLAKGEVRARPYDGVEIAPDTLLRMPLHESLVHIDGSTRRYSVRPYARFSMCASVVDAVYCVWSGGIDLSGAQAAGEPLPTISIEHTPVPLTAAERAEAMERVNEIYLNNFRLPDNRPVVEDFVGDDEGRLWIEVLTGRPDADNPRTEFWVVDPATRETWRVVVDRRIGIRQISGGHVYAAATTPEGEPIAIRYRVARP